jgi:hypothetical protein
MHTIAISKNPDNTPPFAGESHGMDARLRRTLELRLHELQRRLPARLTPRDRRELARLKELLKQPQKGNFDG